MGWKFTKEATTSRDSLGGSDSSILVSSPPVSFSIQLFAWSVKIETHTYSI